MNDVMIFGLVLCVFCPPLGFLLLIIGALAVDKNRSSR